MKGLRKIVLDLASKAINVTRLKSKQQQLDYVDGLSAKDKPDLAKRSDQLHSLDVYSSPARPEPQPAPPVSPPSRKPGPRRIPERKSIVSKPYRLNVSNYKILEIYKELQTLRLSEHKHAISVLLRVFIETSVDDYLTKLGIPLTFPTLGSGSKDKSLKKKIEESIEHMVKQGSHKKDFDGVKKGMSDPNHPLSVDLLHAYVHNRLMTPRESDLTQAWDNALPFFEKIWP